MPFQASSLAMVQSTRTRSMSPVSTHGRCEPTACCARIFWVNVIGRRSVLVLGIDGIGGAPPSSPLPPQRGKRVDGLPHSIARQPACFTAPMAHTFVMPACAERERAWGTVTGLSRELLVAAACGLLRPPCQPREQRKEGATLVGIERTEHVLGDVVLQPGELFHLRPALLGQLQQDGAPIVMTVVTRQQ